MSNAPITLSFSLNPDDWFDEAAKFLAVLAWPEWVMQQNRLEGMQDKVGQLAIRRRAERDSAWGNLPQLIKPIYVAPDLASVADAERKLIQRIDNRAQAARMALPFA